MKFKKLGTAALALMLGTGTASLLAGCSCSAPADEMQVMTLSVNPGVEFIVDKNDKVLSVTASNEDGAYILENFSEFTGMSAQDAALKFIEKSEEYGFVVSGTTDGENVTISVSGDGAQNLYNDVKSKISSKIESLGLNIADMVEIDDDQLEEIVAQCYQEYSESQIDEMSDEQLLQLINTSRQETKNILTEDERIAYYQERAEKIFEAKINTIKNHINESENYLANISLNIKVAAMEAAHSAIKLAYDAIDTQLTTVYANLETQKNAYITEKEKYLQAVKDYRSALNCNSDTDTTNDVSAAELESLKNTVTQLKQAAKSFSNTLETTKNTLASTIQNLVETTVHTQLANLNTKINEVLNEITISAETMETAVTEQLNLLKQNYENNSPWTQED